MNSNFCYLFSCRKESVTQLSIDNLYTARETLLENNRGVRVILGPVQLTTKMSRPQPSKCAIHSALPRHTYDTATTFVPKKVLQICLHNLND